MKTKAPTDSATTRSRQHTRGRWSFVLAALLGTIALLGAACGGDDGGDSGGSGGDGGSASADDCPVDALDDADGPVEITLWHAVVGLTAQTLEEFAEEYNASQDKVQVKVESQGQNYEEQQKKFQDSLRDPDTLPNILLAEDTNTQFMVDSGSAAISDVIGAPAAGMSIVAGSTAAATSRGRTSGTPSRPTSAATRSPTGATPSRAPATSRTRTAWGQCAPRACS